MKYILVAASDINHSPYLNYYINLFKSNNIEFNVIKWNKYGNEDQQKNEYSFNKIYDISISHFSKFKYYFLFMLFVIRILYENRGSRIVIFTIPLITFLSPYLLLFHRKMFYLDIRDYSCFYNKLLFKILNRYSLGIVISSNGFKKWLGLNTKGIFINHNVTSSMNKQNGFNKNKTILSIGTFRDINETSNLIYNLNGYKFIFAGNGTMYNELKNKFEHTMSNQMIFKGSYKKSEESIFLNDISFINSTLDSNFNNMNVLTNRLYLASSNYIPQIINNGTYMSEIIEKFSLGIVYNHARDIPLLIEKFYSETTFEIFKHNCQSFLNIVNVENNELKTYLMT